MKLLTFLIFLTLVLPQAQAQTAIQPVTQPTVELEVDAIYQNFNSSNKVVIDQEDIKNSHAPNLPTLLATQANITIATSGFQPNSIYLRGGDAGHVLILIDGVPSYDASTPQRTMNLSNLNLRNVKRIEIMKGSQSVLYGGQALSGIIKIETFPTEIKKQSTALIQGGDKLAEATIETLQPLTDQWAFSGSARGLDAYNPSPVKDSTKAYPQRTGSADATFLHKGEIDNIFKVTYSDDKNQIATTDLNSLGYDVDDFKANTESVTGTWILRKKDFINFSVSQQNTRRIFLLDPQTANKYATAAADQDYQSKLLAMRFDIRPVNTETFWIDTGISLINEELVYQNNGLYMADGNAQLTGVFMKISKLLSNFLFEAGARTEDQTGTYQVGVTWNKIVKLEHSTGFKIPSLFQLYSSYGNTLLKPEKALNTSLAVEGQINDFFFSSITFFDSQFKDLIIVSGSPFKYNNVSSTRTQGAEWLTSYRSEYTGTKVSLALGYQEPKDLDLNDWLVRRAMRTASLRIAQKFTDTLLLSAEVIHTGSRRDVYRAGMSTNYLTLPGYTITNLVADYEVTPQVSVFGRVDNAADLKYETTYGFYNPGRTWRAGTTFSF